MEGGVVVVPAGEKNNLAAVAAVAAAAASSLCPMYFGASCSFMALHLLSRTRGPDLDSARRCRLAEVLLQGSARLLGLLVWRLQRGREALQERLSAAEAEVTELKRLRAENAKANEKVAAIFASREQGWIVEKKKAKLETQALLSRFCTLEAQKEEVMTASNGRIEEQDRVIRSKEDALEEEIRKTTELEGKLCAAQEAAEESRERARKEAEDHAAELWKHKTAFAELVSNHRQLESEMGRALRQIEAARRELDEALEQKEDAVALVEKLAEEISRMQKDAEQKGKVLSALLRKSKLDTAEKQVLLKEVRTAKARETQAELEVEKLRNLCELRHRNGPHALQFAESESSQDKGRNSLASRAAFRHHRALLHYLQAESNKNNDLGTLERGSIIAGTDPLDQRSSKGCEEELVTADIRELQDWVHSEIEKYTEILQQRHYADIEVFTEQLRLKDEKLEAYRWRVLSMEMESKRLHAHIEGLDGDLSRYREESIKLEALLLEKEQEVKSLREELGLQMRQCWEDHPSCPAASPVPPFAVEAPWSEVRIVEREADERWQELEAAPGEGLHPAVETLVHEGGDWKAEQTQLESQHGEDADGVGRVEPDSATAANSAASLPFTAQLEIHDEQFVAEGKRGQLASEHPEQGMVSATSQAPADAAEEEKEVSVDPGHGQLKTKQNLSAVSEAINKEQVSGQSSSSSRDSPWKLDLHALGISYKIKRLKQQFLVLEKLAGAQESGDKPVEHEQQPKALLEVISLLNKQVKRYQSLEEKADDLCKRMENDREGRSPCLEMPKKEQTGALEGFLEEAFHLQRHIVATGQKLLGVQSRLADSAGREGGHPPGLDAGQFAKVSRALFWEIQRGFEVRVARIIGSLEGTLASDGILHTRS